MTAVVLDTDVFSYLHANRPELKRFVPHLAGRSPVLAFPTVAEVHYGAARSGWGPARLDRLEADLAAFPVLPVTDDLLRECGRLRAAAVRRGHPLGSRQHTADLWIAACAVHHGVPLLTGNDRHFAGLPGLDLVPTGDGGPSSG